MKLKQIRINQHFWMSGKKYLCTDVGTRTIAAIRWDLNEKIPMIEGRYKGKKLITKKVMRKRKLEDFNGPPYHVVEIVIDEYALESCTISPPRK